MQSSKHTLTTVPQGDGSPPVSSRARGLSSRNTLILKGLSLLMLLSTAACGSNSPNGSPGGETDSPKVNVGKTACNVDNDCRLVGGICKKKKGEVTGVCENPTSGCINTKCLIGYECDRVTNACVESRCTTACLRGQCSKTEDKCVNASSCSVATELVDCVAGNFCYVEPSQNRGVCLSPEEIGNKLNCGSIGNPGVYNPAVSHTECVDPPRCNGDNECTSRRCVSAGVGVPGVCEKDYCLPPDACQATGGECVNDSSSPTGYHCASKSTCERASDCASPEVCIRTGSVGKCTALDDVCAKSCVGNRTCTYKASVLNVTCSEKGSCGQDVDCDPGRICKASKCAPGPAACPNDPAEGLSGASEGDAVPYKNGAANRQQYICGDDADYIKYEAQSNGTIMVRLALDSNSYQRRVIKLVVTDGNGAQKVLTNQNGDGTLSRIISTAVNVTQNETILIGVMAADGSADNHVTIGYKLTVSEVNPNSIEICKESNIESLPVDGTVVDGGFNGLTGIASSCVNAAGYYYSQPYKIEVAKRSYVAIRVAGNGGENLALSVRHSCFIKDSEVNNGCVDKDNVGGAEAFGEVLDPGTYYVVVTGNSIGQNVTYRLSAKATETMCTPSTPKVCESSGDLKVCNDTQTGYDYDDCDFKGCSEQGGVAVCNGPQGDTCANPEVVTAGHEIINKKINLESLRDTYRTRTNCTGINPADTNGKDYVFSAVLKDGEALAGSVKGPGSKKSAYIVEDCADLNTCLATAAEDTFSAFGSDPLNIFWKNDTGAEKTVFLILDYFEPNDRPSPKFFTVNLRVGVPLCEPRSTKCPNGNKIFFCNDLGSKYDGKPPLSCTCDVGVANPTCQSKVEGDSCDNPKEVNFTGSSFSETVDTTAFTNKTPKQPLGCGTILLKSSSNAPADGSRDYVLKLTPQANKSYEISIDPKGTFQPVLWVAKADVCESPSAAIPTSSCIDGLASQSGTRQTLLFAPPDATKPYYIVISSFNNTPGSFDLTIEEKDKGHSPYEIVGCNSGGTGIVYADKAGIERVYKCACQLGAKVCDSQTGETCYDAKVIYPASPSVEKGSVSETLFITTRDDIGKMVHHSPDDYHIDRCLYSPSLNSTPRDGDQFYKFTLNRDDILVINFIDKKNALAPFFQEGNKCSDPDTCFGTIGGRGTQTLTYKAVKDDEDIFFVVKYAAGVPHDSPYKFDWHVYTSANPPTCIPTSTQCDEADSTGKKIKVCNADGTEERVHTCKNRCVDGLCEPTLNGETCEHAIDAGTGGVFIVNNKFGSDVARPLCLDNIGKDGFDTFFEVEAKKGQLITASNASVIESGHSIYIFDDCSNINNSCLAGASAPNADGLGVNAAKLDFVAPADGTYYIGITGSGFRTNTEVFYVKIDVKDSQCDESTPLSCSGGELTYCNNGQVEKLSCTCQDATMCSNHIGEICQMPIALTKKLGVSTKLPGEKILSSQRHVQPQVAPVNGIAGNCMFSKDLSGPQKFYTISLDKGETLKVHIKDNTSSSSSQGETQFYLLEECTDTCLASAERSPGSYESDLIFTASKKGNYTIVLNSDLKVWNNKNDLTFDITYEVTAMGGQCEPYTGYCKDAFTLATCSPEKSYVNVSCDCLDGRCLLANDDADACATAPLVPDGFTTIVPFRVYTHNLSVDKNGSSCTKLGSWSGGTVGHDAYFRFTVPKKRTLRVSTANSSRSGETEVYILSSCKSGGSACLADAESNNYGSRFALDYTAGNTDETIIVGVSHSESYSDEDFARSVSFNLLGDTCDPLTDTNVTCTTGVLTYCDASSSTIVTYNCDGATCNPSHNGCANPTGAICADAKLLPLDGSPQTGDLLSSGLTNRVGLTTGNFCTYEAANGNDIVYKANLDPGKKMTVTLKSTAPTPQDLSLYVTSNCDKPDDGGPGCSGSDAAGGVVETVSVKNNGNAVATYYIYVDSKTSVPAGEGAFSLKATVSP